MNHQGDANDADMRLVDIEHISGDAGIDDGNRTQTTAGNGLGPSNTTSSSSNSSSIAPSSPLNPLTKLGRYIMANIQGDEGDNNDNKDNQDKEEEEEEDRTYEREHVERNNWESGASTTAGDDDNSNAFHMLGDSSKYKDRYLERQHTIFVMVLNEDGTHSYKDMRRDEILRECRQDIYTLSGGRISNPRVMFRGATQPRDIRVLDPGFSIIENAILIRRHAILLKLSPIHAVILRNKLILVVPEGADKILHDLQSKLKALATSECNGDQVQANEMAHPEVEKVDKSHTVKKKQSVKWSADDSRKSDLEGKIANISKDSIQSSISGVGNKRKEFEGKKSVSLRSFFSNSHKDPEEDAIEPPSSISEVRSSTPSGTGEDYESTATSASNRAVIPFELRALEAIFLILSNILEGEFEELYGLTLKTTKNLIKKSSGAFLERLRQRKNDVAKMLTRIRAIRDAVETVLEDDADLALMRLSKVFQNPSRYSHANVEEWSADHEDVELLLENYMQIFEDIIARTDLIQQDILATENIINLRLDTARNGLLQVNLMVSSVTSAAAVAAVVAGIFGMNLNSGVQEDPYWFWAVAGTLVFGTIVTVIITFTVLYKKGYLIT